MSWYCEVSRGHPWHGPHHDTEYGFHQTDETVLFERLALEINQAGLSWLTVLKKRAALNRAFDGFAVDVVAGYGDADVARLMQDASIIRNRLKITSIIENARRVQALRDSHGGFSGWLDAHHPRELTAWVKLFKATFKFTGPEICNEFLMSLAYLPGAHHEDCPVQARIRATNPPWMQAGMTQKG